MLYFGAWVCFVLFVANLLDWVVSVHRDQTNHQLLGVAVIMLVLSIGFYVGDMAVSGAL